jgi:hypothetical protein
MVQIIIFLMVHFAPKAMDFFHPLFRSPKTGKDELPQPNSEWSRDKPSDNPFLAEARGFSQHPSPESESPGIQVDSEPAKGGLCPGEDSSIHERK